MKNNFIEVYKNVIPGELCDELMGLFNKYPNLTHQGASMQGVNKEIKSSTDLNIIRIDKLSNEKKQKLMIAFHKSLAKYFNEYNLKNPLWLHGDIHANNSTGDSLTNELLKRYVPDSSTILLKRYT